MLKQPTRLSYCKFVNCIFPMFRLQYEQSVVWSVSVNRLCEVEIMNKSYPYMICHNYYEPPQRVLVTFSRESMRNRV